MTERSGVRLDTGHFIAVRMPVQTRERLHEGIEFFAWKKSGIRKCGIQRTRAVPFAQDEAIPFGRIGCARINTENTEVQRHQDIDSREIPANVPESGIVDHL